MAIKITNKQILQALQMLGFIPKDAKIDIKGGQTTLFAARLSTYGIDNQKFAQAQAFVNFANKGKGRTPDREGNLAGFKDFFNSDQPTAAALYEKRGTTSPGFKAFLKTLPTVKPMVSKGNLSIGDRYQNPKMPGIQTPPPGTKAVKLPAPGVVPPVSIAPLGSDDSGYGSGDGGEDVGPPVSDIPSIPALRKGASPDEVDAYVKQYYGYLSWALDIPELKGLVMEIAENPSGFTPEAVQGRLSGTDWWKKNGQNSATWLRRREEDPATTQQEIEEKYYALSKAAKAGGIEIPTQRLWAMAEESLKWNWGEGEMQAILGSEYRFDPSKPTAMTSNLRTLAHDYMVPMGDTALGVWTKQILAGEKSEEEFKQYLTQTATSMFPTYAAGLARGETMKVQTDAYRQLAARTLELNPDTIDFTDPKWLKTLTQVDPKTGERTAMSMSGLDQLIRTDPAYGYEYTKQSMDEAGSLASSLMTQMGVTK